MVKRDSFKGKAWGGQTSLDTTDNVFAFDPNGKTIVMSWDKKHLREYDPTTPNWSIRHSEIDYLITCVVCCPINPGLFAVSDERGGLNIVSKADGHKFKSLCRLIPVNSGRVSACAWSQDGKWIATGNNFGDIFIWNADDPTSVSFAMALTLPCIRTAFSPITSLVFLPDSTALLFIFGGNLLVWDIENVEYVANSGLPDDATNIALDGPRNRLAVTQDSLDRFHKVKITIYELKLREEMCQMTHMDGKDSIPSPGPSPPSQPKRSRRWFNLKF